MDRNQYIGFGLLAALVVVYVVYTSNEQKQFAEQKRKQYIADSIASAANKPILIADTSKKTGLVAATPADTIQVAPAFRGKEQIVTFQNKKVSLQFTTKGAYPVSAEIKNFKTYGGKPLVFFNGAGNELSAILPVDNGRSTASLYFEPTVKEVPNGDKIIDFAADMGNGKKVDIIYTLHDTDYMVDCNVRLTGMTASSLKMNWNVQPQLTEKDVTTERLTAQVFYRYKDGDNDYFTMRDPQDKTLNNGARWTGVRSHYFSTILVSDDGFNGTDIKSNTKLADSSLVSQVKQTMEVPLKNGNEASMHWFIGPNEYRLLTSYKMGFEEMVPLGYGVFAFVKYINKWMLIPIFYFVASFVSNYGLIIILMTLFIRLILSFFTYKSYLSAAKMRVLKPELDELRAKYAGDQQKFGMEQMKLYKTAGVNPLGGCLPLLFQMPILLSMYYLFPSFIEFRQKSFLWAHDLSTYDSVAHLPFSIPFYGDHVSLFTLLMTASSLFLALYNRNMTPQDPNNPMMKYMPFIFPIIFLGVFNKMAAALTCYYFFSNTISIIQQFVIQKYFINEKAIHAQIQENKTKPPTTSKWAARMEEIQKAQAEKAKIKGPKK